MTVTQPKGEMLDLTNPRYWRQNAQMAVRDVHDALIELITNADDRYAILRVKHGRIEIEVERKRKDSGSIIRVRDFADGMTTDIMKRKLSRIADRVSGLDKGEAVRGTNSRGAKDVAILGGVIFESVAVDGQYHRFEITPQGRWTAGVPTKDRLGSLRKELKIPTGTGTVVTIQIDPEIAQVPQHDTLRDQLSRLVALRDILSSQDRELFLYDINKDRMDRINPPFIEGRESANDRLEIPGYPSAEAKLIIKRSKKPFEDRRSRFRLGGVLIKSRRAIHEATLFASDLENDPHAQWFFGTLKCDFIDDLWNEFDDRFEKGQRPTDLNSRPIYDPLRKEGLSREHPFVDALFKEALKRLRPLVEMERKRAEGQQAKIENDATRRRLNALEKAAAKFMGENLDLKDLAREPNATVPSSSFEGKGYSLTPPFAQIVLGQSVRFWLNIKQEAFPELAAGDSVEITCATDEIATSKGFGILEVHPNQAGILRCIWTVKGEKVTEASGIKVRVGSIIVERVVEVIGSERERYEHIKELSFNHKRYTVQAGARKSVVVYAPYPQVVSAPMPLKVECSSKRFTLIGDMTLVPQPDLGIASCKLRLIATDPDQKTLLTASISGHACEAEVVSIDPPGNTIKIEPVDIDYGNQRSRWRGNVLEIAARHPSLKRYLGGPPEFRGQEDKHFRVLLAEIVAEAVCARIMSRNQPMYEEEEQGDLDWDNYYAKYTALLTKFLPIAHETQVQL